ncbi:aminoacyl-tRNA hydrolase [bacterium]|nr:aminoacyl-tRNA hydrolase [bacterium]
MWLFAGLGNPGPDYENTRHNVGFDLVDLLSKRWKVPIDQKGPAFLFGTGDFLDQPVALVKPMTFMNRSGVALRRLMNEPEFSPQETLVLYDEVHIPLGALRIRRKGSHGGHNGLRSIIDSLQTDEIPRMRIGVGEPVGDWADYVLSPFPKKEREVIDDTLITAIDAVETVLKDGIEKAMNLFNQK